VGDHHGSAAARLEGVEVILQALGAVLVQAREGLVQQQDPRLAEHRAGQRHAPPQPAGEGADAGAGLAVEADLRERRVDPGPVGPAAGQTLGEGQVFARSEVVVEMRAVADHGDHPAHLVAPVDEVVSGDPPPAGRGARERGQHTDQRRLPGAVVAENGEHLSRGDLQRHAAQGDVGTVELGQAFCLDHAAGRLLARSRGEHRQARGPANTCTVAFWMAMR
jgi:hypothetical protein